LTEKLLEEGGWADLYRLAEELRYELDDMLIIVEAAELLGFVKVAEGDITLTPLGKAFAEASIQARKEIVAGRLLRLPIIRWIYETLHADDDGRVSADYFREQLQLDFTLEEAERQLDMPSTGAVMPSSLPTTKTPTSSSSKRSRPQRWIKSQQELRDWWRAHTSLNYGSIRSLAIKEGGMSHKSAKMRRTRLYILSHCNPKGFSLHRGRKVCSGRGKSPAHDAFTRLLPTHPFDTEAL
jgi:hypothetical protein